MSNHQRFMLACVLASSLLLLLALARPAYARSERVVYYSFEQVWPAAVRFLRVDAGFEVVEKDAEAGYILFSVEEERKRFRGALELIRFTDENGRPGLRLALRIDDRPSYMEHSVLEKLEAKLRSELGEPPPPPPPAQPKQPDKPAKKTPPKT